LTKVGRTASLVDNLLEVRHEYRLKQRRALIATSSDDEVVDVDLELLNVRGIEFR
jgi:hypothetical protein